MRNHRRAPLSPPRASALISSKKRKHDALCIEDDVEVAQKETPETILRFCFAGLLFLQQKKKTPHDFSGAAMSSALPTTLPRLGSPTRFQFPSKEVFKRIFSFLPPRCRKS